MSLSNEEMQTDLVLVIDDDPLILESVQQILDVLGWNVLAAADGQKGIALFADHPGQIGVVLLDMSMPGMDGIATLQALREIDSGVNVILLSGHSQQEIGGRFSGAERTTFLQKPFDLNVLVDEVTSMMAEANN